MSRKTDNRRDYVRIQAEIGLSWKRIDADERENISEIFAQRSRTIGLMSELNHNSEAMAPAMRKITEDHPQIAAYLKFLHTALANLTEEVTQRYNNDNNIQPQAVIISAGGIEFECDTACVNGDLLEIVLEISPTRATMMVVAEVIRTATASRSAPGTTQLALAFKHIRDADQELLIRHIHRIQLEDLQRARNDRRAA